MTDGTLRKYLRSLTDEGLRQEGIYSLTQQRMLLKQKKQGTGDVAGLRERVREVEVIRDFIIQDRGLVSMWRDIMVEVGEKLP